VRVKRALRFARQAQFRPLPYLDGLAGLLVAAGGEIYEQSPVASVGGARVELRDGPAVKARYVVDATHTPVGVVASLQTRLAAMTSYVLAARVDSAVPQGLYWDCADPYHYVRAADEGGELVLIGGEDHPTGREPRPSRRYEALERWARGRFPVRAIEARWSHELFEPADGLPYIGPLPGDRSRLVATGFSGTGMTFGTVAALALAEWIVNGSSPWESLYSPSRLGPVSALPHALEENLRIGWRFVADRLRGRGTVEDVPRGGGRVVREGREQVAVHRDLQGHLHRLSARCTHLGCIVSWNDTEKSWDCPCHGGRFHATGEVLYGPPVADLERKDESSAR
jgi:Rieske Fe-S protein